MIASLRTRFVSKYSANIFLPVWINSSYRRLANYINAKALKCTGPSLWMQYAKPNGPSVSFNVQSGRF